MDFNLEIKKEIDLIIKDKMPEMINKHASKMIEEIVSDLFRWGDARTKIKDKIQESINVNLESFDLIDYGALIAKVINDNLIQQVNLQPIIDMTHEVVGFVNKKTISLAEIAEMFIEASKDEDERELEGEITFITNERPEYGWMEVYADIESDKNEDDCSIKFIFSTKGSRAGYIFSFKIREYCDKKHREVSPARLVAMRKIEAKIFRLYSAQVRITDYDDVIETCWDRY
ncbi:hypothetical protein BWK59_15175 [Flavobacterium davisii]|uniref:Uncharacterized protein n=1 Tax=Flavobacterium davisii TaxID=2906077 RepID=A0A246GEP4_9FLAO|nr:hypothetical protein [Flavobacterium davisii]OWP82574.1 hypothetical protein BWK59_15175 [Flavobacterium davisii]